MRLVQKDMMEYSGLQQKGPGTGRGRYRGKKGSEEEVMSKSAEKAAGKIRHVRFEVTTATPLPAGQQVFISGSDVVLGEWKADGFPLTRVDDTLWTATAALPAAVPVEYKITRGMWENEQVDAQGDVPENYRLSPGGDVSVSHTVTGWKDGRFSK